MFRVIGFNGTVQKKKENMSKIHLIAMTQNVIQNQEQMITET